MILESVVEQVGAQVVDQRGDVVERLDGAEDVGVGAHEHGVEAVLVEPGGQPAVEVLELRRGRRRARRCARGTPRASPDRCGRPPGEQDELLADDVVEAALAAVDADHALHGAMAGQRPARGQRARPPAAAAPSGGGASGARSAASRSAAALRVERARHAAHLGGEVHDPLVLRLALGRVAVEQPSSASPRRTRSSRQASVRGVAHARAQALAHERRHRVRGVAGERAPAGAHGAWRAARGTRRPPGARASRRPA